MTQAKCVGCGMWDAPVPTARRCAGTTLVELIVVLALLGLVLAVSGLSLASLRPTPEAQAVKELGRARAQAIRTGRPVHLLGTRGDSVTSHTPHPTPSWTFLPDGRALGPGVDLITGAPDAP